MGGGILNLLITAAFLHLKEEKSLSVLFWALSASVWKNSRKGFKVVCVCAGV